MFAAGDHVLVAGSYSSVEARRTLLAPPATRTWPFGRSVAVWPTRAWVMLPAEDQEFVVGSYSSAEARYVGGMGPQSPPATRTLPLGRRMAAGSLRSWPMLAAGDQPFVAGSYSSAVASFPPATRTLPFASSVAVWPSLASDIDPAEFQAPSPAAAGPVMARRNDPTSVPTTMALRPRPAVPVTAPFLPLRSCMPTPPTSER